MVFTRKFSQFTVGGPVANGDIIVGYQAQPQSNTQWTFAGGGGTGTLPVIWTVSQPNNFTVGVWVALVNGVYVAAKADTAQDAEVMGIVQSIITPGLVFTVQQSGYITLPTTLGYIAGGIYFLDPDNQGLATLTEPFVNGQVSRPVIIMDSNTTGLVLPYRGYIIGGGAPVNPGTTIVTRIIHQVGHGFVPGNWLRTAALSEPSNPYALALADTLAHAQAVGVVIEVIDADHFVIQVDGFVGPGIFGFPLVAGTIYYLSDTTPGLMVDTAPITLGEATKPLFSADMTNSGWILPQRPLTIESPSGGGSGVTWTIVQPGNTFTVGQWLRLNTNSPTPLYVLAQADTAQDADVIGVVQSIIIPGSTFILQQSGFCQFGPGYTGSLVVGQNYFLDDAVAGGQSLSEPVTNGHVSRPVMTSYTTSSGWVLPYRGYVIGGGAPVNPGGGIVTRHISQTGHGFSLGDWLRTQNSVPSPYVLAQADTLSDSWAVGVVIEILDANNFILQEVGYLGPGIFTGLTAGSIYYLSATSAGDMTSTPPAGIGAANKPLFSAETTVTGWILNHRPDENEASSTNVIIETITLDNHGFSEGDFLITWTQTSPIVQYALADASSLATSYVVGVVLEVIDVNTFLLQSNGYLIGVLPGSQVQGDVYFLDPAHPGKVTNVMPTTIGQAIVPCYSADSSSSGWLIPFRPIEITPLNANNIIQVTQPGHGFVAGQWLKNVSTLSNPRLYALAQATTLANAYLTVGVVTFVIDANNFLLQQSGYVIFDSSQLPSNPVLTPGGEYFLSPTVGGAQQTTEPLSPLPSRPTFQCTVAVASTSAEGWILPQKPTIVGGSSGGEDYVLISTTNLIGLPVLDLPNIFNGTYTDIEIIGRNIQFNNTFTFAPYGNSYGANIRLQLYINGILAQISNVFTALYSQNQTNSTSSQVASSSSQWFLPGYQSPNPYFYSSVSGDNFNFDVKMLGIPASTAKTAFVRTIATNSLNTSSPTQIWDWSGVMPAASNLGFFGPLTGLKFTLNAAPFGGSVQTVTNGTISIYGIKA